MQCADPESSPMVLSLSLDFGFAGVRPRPGLTAECQALVTSPAM